MTFKTIIIICLFIWGAPSTYFRSKFRKIVYKTDDWKINIKSLFLKEIRALIFNIYPNNNKYLQVRNYYRFYLLIYLLLLFVFYIIF
jgi:peroxiredoxin Q/BCP